MKTILKIITILIAASTIAGGFILAVNKSLGTSSSITGNQFSTNGQITDQPMGHPEGFDRSEASTSRGLAGMFATFIELTGITAIVLLIENLFSISKNRKVHASQR